MPAKEQVQVDDKPLKESTHTDESLSNSSSNQGSPAGLIHKIYGAVLSRDAVKKGVLKIKTKYHDVLEESRHQIDGIKRKGESVYNSTRERVKAWAYSITIYNHFTSLWLIKNLPYGEENIVSFDDFLSSFQTLSKDSTQEAEDLARTFYKQARDLWENMKEPQLNDIKQCCLNITARSIAIDYKIEVEGFPAALVELFNTLDNKRTEVISNEAFYIQIRKRIATKLPNEVNFRRATDTFYTFAKRFAFLEFPLTYANQDILKVLVKFAQEKLDILAELFLNRVDGVLNVVIKKLGYEYQQKEDPVTLLDRYHVIVDKLVMVSSTSYNKTRLAIQGTKTYQFVDKRVHFEDRYNELARVSKYIYDMAAARVTPAWNAITLTYNKVTREYVFALYDISRELVKANYARLKNKYSCLKDVTLKLRDNILEIKLTKETFDKLSADAKEQVVLIYAEVRGLNYDKLKVLGGKAYQRAVDVVKSGVKSLTCRGTEATAEKQPVEEEKQPEKTEKQPQQTEEQPLKPEEPKTIEESPKIVEEQPKTQEESQPKVEEQPQVEEQSKEQEEPQKKLDESYQQVEEPKKEEEQPVEEENQPVNDEEEKKNTKRMKNKKKANK